MRKPSIQPRSKVFLAAVSLLCCISARPEFIYDPLFKVSLDGGPFGKPPRIVCQPDGRILLGGGPYASVSRLLELGVRDTTFSTGKGFETITNGTTSAGTVNAIAVQSDGKILVGGSFTSFDQKPVSQIVRLNADGSLDSTFDTGPLDGAVAAISIRADGKIYVAGIYPKPRTRKTAFIRLHADGKLDSNFEDTPLGVNGAEIQNLVIGADGKPVVTASYVTAASTVVTQVLRLNIDGGLDQSFALGAGTQNQISKIAVQPDGKILVAILGTDQKYNGVAVKDLLRLNQDGTLEAGYRPGTGLSGPVLDMIALPDGRSLVRVGSIWTTVVKLNADGSRDPRLGSVLLGRLQFGSRQFWQIPP